MLFLAVPRHSVPQCACHLVMPKTGLEWAVVTSRASKQTTHSQPQTHNIQNKQNSVSKLHSITSLSTDPYSDTKDNSSKCVQWLRHSTAFSSLFTCKSRVTDTPEQWNHTTSQRNASGYTTRAWESLWPLGERQGRGLATCRGDLSQQPHTKTPRGEPDSHRKGPKRETLHTFFICT